MPFPCSISDKSAFWTGEFVAQPSTVTSRLYFIPLLNPKRDLRRRTYTLLETNAKRIPPSWRTHDNLHLSVWCPIRLDIWRIYSEILLNIVAAPDPTGVRPGHGSESRPPDASRSRSRDVRRRIDQQLSPFVESGGKFPDAVTLIVWSFSISA
jgi:hypothetical protein